MTHATKVGPISSAIILCLATLLFHTGVMAADCSFVGVDISGDQASATQRAFECNQLHLFDQAGISIYGRERLSWSVIEPNPPVNGIHTYVWEDLDHEIQEVEAVGGVMSPTLMSNAAWAVERTDPFCSPPKEGFIPESPGMTYWDAWSDFVTALVERYDNDGIDDMPGLQYAHRHWQIGTEFENIEHWNTADGTQRVEKYVALLGAAFEAAKQAHAETKIISFSFNFGDAFDDNPTVGGFNIIFHPLLNAKRDFAVQVWQQGQNYFDLVGTNTNYHYNGLAARVRWIRSHLPDKPIWFVDAAPARLLNKQYLQPPLYDQNVYPYKSEQEIGEILIFRDDPEHAVIKKWFEEEKAKYAMKKALIAASLGVENINFQFIADTMGSNNYWGSISEMAFSLACGLLEYGYDYEPEGTAKPVYYAIKQFNEIIGGFDSVTDLNPLPAGIDPTGWTWKLKFTKDDREILAVWSEGGEQTLDLSSHFPSSLVKVTHIVTALDENLEPVYPDAEVVPADSVLVDTAPMFVESTPKPTCECELRRDFFTINRGDPLGYQVTVTNNTNETQVFKFATRIAYLWGYTYYMYPTSGYLQGPYQVTLGPNESMSAHLWASVPSFIPSGVHKYIGYVGTAEAGIYDTCEFEFNLL